MTPIGRRDRSGPEMVKVAAMPVVRMLTPALAWRDSEAAPVAENNHRPAGALAKRQRPAPLQRETVEC